jgi:hypothetical protein
LFGGRSSLVIGSVAVALLLLNAPSALACNEPSISIYAPAEVRAGDTVYYELTDVDVGAQYSIKANGQPVASGAKTTDGQGYRGSFQVPDLGGSDQDVSFDGYVFHPDDGASSNPSSAQARYRAAQPATPPAQPTSPEPAAGQPPAGTGSVGTQPAAPDPSLGGGRPGPGRSPSGPAPTRPRPQGSPESAAPTAEVSRPAAAGHTALTHVGHAARTEAAGRSREAVKPAPATSPPTPASLTWPPEAWASARQADDAGDGSPPGVLIAIGALLLVAGVAGGGGALVRLRRRGPEPEPPVAPAAATGQDTEKLDGVEAALQELLAEERARRVLTPRDQPEDTESGRDEIGAPR